MVRIVAGWRRMALLPLGLVIGMLGSGVLVWQASQGAFTAQTSTDNHVQAGSVVIDNERSGGLKLINVSTLVPGQDVVQCVLVTYTGTVTATVKLFAGAYSDDVKNLGGTVTIKVETADNGGYGDCAAGFNTNTATILPAETTDVFALRTAFASGVPATSPWQPTASGQDRAYRITVSLPSNAGDGVQGGTLDLNLIWEAQT